MNVLPSIIHHNQTGFIKDRYIGETVRSIFDIMDFTVEENIPGLLIFIDFQKAFDSLEWNFLLRCLESFSFGASLIRWVFTFYKNIQSGVINFETMSTLMYDISNDSVPQNISRLFSKSNSIHPYKTRSSSSGNFYIQYSRLNQQRNSTTGFGTRVWNCLPPQVRQLPKKQFKKKVREILFAIFHAEDTYVEAPTLLLKITKYVK